MPYGGYGGLEGPNSVARARRRKNDGITKNKKRNERHLYNIIYVIIITFIMVLVFKRVQNAPFCTLQKYPVWMCFGG